MRAIYGKYKLVPGKPPTDAMPWPGYGGSLNHEPTHYCFYEIGEETWIELKFRDEVSTYRIVTIEGNSICGIPKVDQAGDLQDVIGEFACEIWATGKKPELSSE